MLYCTVLYCTVLYCVVRESPALDVGSLHVGHVAGVVGHHHQGVGGEVRGQATLM